MTGLGGAGCRLWISYRAAIEILPVNPCLAGIAPRSDDTFTESLAGLIYSKFVIYTYLPS